MKILFLSHRIPWPIKDGGALAIHNNLKGFIDAGHDVKLLCLNPNKDQTSLKNVPDYFAKANPTALPVNTDLSAWAAFKNLFSKQSYHVIRFYLPEFAEALKTELRSHQYEVVHMEGAFIAQYTSLIRVHSKACLVLREHNVEYRIWESMARMSGNQLKTMYLNLLAARLQEYEESLWKQVDMIDAISPDDLVVFKQFNPNSYLGGAGFELETYMRVKEKGEPKTIFHLGSMDWLPNREAMGWLLNSIWPEIHKSFPEWKLFLAGKKMPREWMRQGFNLRIEGEVESAIAYMAQYQVMVVPLKSGSGVRIKTIEAMALGKVVITTLVGLRGLDLEHGKEVLVANTPSEFVAAIRFLEENPDQVEKIGHAARLKVQALYSNENHIARLIEKYRNCKP